MLKEAGKSAQSMRLILSVTHEGTASAPSQSATAGAGAPRDLLKTVLASLEDSKAEDLVTIDIHDKSALGDCMVVASGRSHRHVGSIADRLLRDLKDAGQGAGKAEGLPHCDWVLIDAGDVIVHIFRPEVRDFYNIEKMWAADSYSERRYSA